MEDNKIYQKEINTIFSYLAMLQDKYTDNDNLNFITNLDDYRKDVIEFSKLIIEKGEQNDR